MDITVRVSFDSTKLIPLWWHINEDIGFLVFGAFGSVLDTQSTKCATAILENYPPVASREQPRMQELILAFTFFPIQIRATFCRAFTEKVKQFWWMAIHDWQYFLLCQQHIMATTSRRWRRCWWAARSRLAAAAGHRSTTITGCGLALDWSSLNRVWNVKTFHRWKADGCVVRQALIGDHFLLIILNFPL